MPMRIVAPLRVLAPLTLGLLLAAGCGEDSASPPPLVPSPMPEAPRPLPPAAALPDAPPPPRPVMAEAQKKWLANLEASLAARDSKQFAALFSHGAILVSAGKDHMHQAVGRMEIERGHERGLSVMAKAFPDIKWTHTRALQHESTMVVEWVGSGTDTGGFLEDKPTGKKVGWRGVSVLRFDDDGLAKHETNIIDPSTILGQLGRPEIKTRVRQAPPAVPSSTEWIAATGKPEEEKNLETVRALYPLLEKKDETGLGLYLTDDVVRSDQSQPDDVKGKANVAKDLASWAKVLPDLKVDVTRSWAFGDVVVTEIGLTGTFKGPLGALKPNGRLGTTHRIDVFDLKAGKISRVTTYANSHEFLYEYDLLPKPAAAAPAPSSATPPPAPKP